MRREKAYGQTDPPCVSTGHGGGESDVYTCDCDAKWQNDTQFKTMLGFHMPAPEDDQAPSPVSPEGVYDRGRLIVELPETVDWRQSGFTTPVRRQVGLTPDMEPGPILRNFSGCTISKVHV